MFSTGQWYFALFFVIVFIATMIYVYRKDLKELKELIKELLLIISSSE